MRPEAIHPDTLPKSIYRIHTINHRDIVAFYGSQIATGPLYALATRLDENDSSPIYSRFLITQEETYASQIVTARIASEKSVYFWPAGANEPWFAISVDRLLISNRIPVLFD